MFLHSAANEAGSSCLLRVVRERVSHLEPIYLERPSGRDKEKIRAYCLGTITGPQGAQIGSTRSRSGNVILSLRMPFSLVACASKAFTMLHYKPLTAGDATEMSHNFMSLRGAAGAKSPQTNLTSPPAPPCHSAVQTF